MNFVKSLNNAYFLDMKYFKTKMQKHAKTVLCFAKKCRNWESF